MRRLPSADRDDAAGAVSDRLIESSRQDTEIHGGPESGERIRVPEEAETLSVTEAMTIAKRALEGLRMRVVGEVSDAKDSPGWKAVYFKLRDEGAAMQCLMWRDAYERAGLELRDGMLVEVSGGFTAYPPKGQMQFQVRSVEAAGEGVLRMRVAALARELEAEGLMRAERKRDLPAFPARIGLVTSPRGAAVHDVLRTLRRRFPVAEVVLAGTAVEGEAAAAGLVAALERVSSEAGVEVVVLVRGGGSYEDLMPFNDESLARAIAGCPVPVVTGIGHEPDVTIADMVADVRGSTPTAAAEAVAPSTGDVDARFASLARMLAMGLRDTARVAGQRVSVAASSPALRDPRTLLAVASQRTDLTSAGLTRAIPRALDSARAGAAGAVSALRAAGTRMVGRGSDALGLAAARLSSLSPLGVLARGFAVCYDEAGTTVVRSAHDISQGDKVRVRMHDGAAACLVEDVSLEGEDG